MMRLKVNLSVCETQAVYGGKQYNVVCIATNQILLQPQYPVDIQLECPIEHKFGLIIIRIIPK